MLVKHLTHCKEDISQVLFKFQYSSVDSRMTPLFIEALLKTEDEEDIKNFLSCIAIKDNSSIRSIILEYLDHPSDIIKIGAIECLQQSTQDDAAEAKLIELLEKVQGNWIFMKEIAKALNSVGSKKCVSVLVRSLSTVKQYLPEDSKADHCFSQLLRALNTFGEQKIVREHLYHLYSIKDLIHEYWELIHPIQDLYSNENLPFLETLLSKDNDTLLHLIGATLYRINTLESRAVLIRALKNPNIKISTEAVKILGIMRCKESVPAILEYFSQYPNHDLVLRSLIRIGDPKSIEPIYESIKNSKQEVQIIDKWNALGRLQDKRAIEPLCMYLKSGIPDELKAKIIITLSLWPEANTISFLRTQLGKETPEIEGLLLMALGRLKDTYSRKILLEAFKSKKNYIFGGAAIGLGFMDIDNYSTYVMEAANIYESNIRIPAKRLIFTLSNPLITQKFLNSQKESIADIKIENINIMGYTGNPTFIPPLIAALKDPFIHVRQAAIQALTCFDRPDVKTALTEMLADSHKGVADDAKKALNLAPRESFVFISDQVINPWPNDIFNDSRF
jgi:HEAT repeat protein